MGQIQKIVFRFVNTDRTDIAQLIRSAPHFDHYVEEYGIFEFRGKGHGINETTPDCAIHIENDGIVFNALGNYDVCRSVENALLKKIQATFGKTEIQP